MGIIYNKIENYKKAIEYFNKCIELDNTNAVYYHNRGCSYKSLNDINQAIKDISIAIELNNKEKIFYENRVFMYQKNGNYELAIKDYDILYNNFEKKENNNYDKLFENFQGRGLCYFEIHLYDKALLDFNKALQINNNNLFCLYKRAKIYEFKNDINN